MTILKKNHGMTLVIDREIQYSRKKRFNVQR